MKRLLLFVLGLFMIFAGANAASPAWTLDKAHSNIIFSVRHMVISEVTGTFKDFNVSLQSVKEDFGDAEINATINVNSINTENDRRDAHLKTDDFFNAEKYPTITFKSDSVEKIGEGHFVIKGLLTIRDSTHEVSIDAVHNGTLMSKNGERAGWKATLTINRFDYGLRWNQALEAGGLIAGSDVTIVFNLEFVRS
ncbi:MAG TPA: YceI family protein [Bacteroidota bacterium]|nr:YceI family protein [Bacteroidota bacterium]